MQEKLARPVMSVSMSGLEDVVDVVPRRSDLSDLKLPLRLP